MAPAKQTRSSTTSNVERSIQELIRGNETDAEIDQIVADLLAQEARESSVAGSSRDSSTIKHPERKQLNPRFLNGILRSTETHNRSLREREQHESGHSRASRQGHDRDRPLDSAERGRITQKSRLRGWSDDERESGGKHDVRTASSRRTDKSISHSTKHADRRSYSPERSPRRSHSHSKMDRYFDKSYDPALDVQKELDVDGSGLVNDDGWDRVLDLVREKDSRKHKRRERRRNGSPAKSSDLLATQYTRRGGERAWDKGKSRQI